MYVIRAFTHQGKYIFTRVTGGDYGNLAKSRFTQFREETDVVSKGHSSNQSQQFVTLAELAAESLTPRVVNDFSAMVLEPNPLKMGWVMLGLVIGWLVVSTVASAWLFQVMKSPLALAPTMVAMGVTP